MAERDCPRERERGVLDVQTVTQGVVDRGRQSERGKGEKERDI